MRFVRKNLEKQNIKSGKEGDAEKSNDSACVKKKSKETKKNLNKQVWRIKK